MKREELKELGLADDVIEKIMIINGKDVEEHKNAVATKTTEVETLQGNLAEANKQIEAFKGMDIDGIKQAADDWKLKAEKAETDAQTKIQQLQFDFSLDNALTSAKAKNAKAVKALLNMDALKFNEGEIIGLSDQLEKIKTDNDYLFDDGRTATGMAQGGTSSTTDTFITAAMNAAGLN